MWYLKYKYKHSDCIYSGKLLELGLNGHFYYLGVYNKGNYVYTSAVIRLIGAEDKIKKYLRYLKDHKEIIKCESYENVVLTLSKHERNLILYGAVYNPALLHPAPVYLDENGFEVTEVACWDREPLEELIKNLEKNKTTEYFEILQLKKKKLDDIYVSKLLKKLPAKQKEAINLALKNGYYKYPRKAGLEKLSKIARVSKQTFRENLRKAEAKILPEFIPE